MQTQQASRQHTTADGSSRCRRLGGQTDRICSVQLHQLHCTGLLHIPANPTSLLLVHGRAANVGAVEVLACFGFSWQINHHQHTSTAPGSTTHSYVHTMHSPQPSTLSPKLGAHPVLAAGQTACPLCPWAGARRTATCGRRWSTWHTPSRAGCQ